MAAPVQLVFDLGHAPALGAEDFLPAACNRVALTWIARWPNWPAPALVVHGPPGAGKTHLACIFARRVRALWCDGRSFLPAVHEIGDVRACVVDRADELTDEVLLLHLYNHLLERRGHLLLTARTPPAAWPLHLADLTSRLRAAPAAEMGPPDDELLAALLVKLCRDRQLVVPENVIRYLVARMERSFAAAHQIVGALDALSLRQQRPVTLALVRRLLGETEDKPA